jgi:hypothetical protein
MRKNIILFFVAILIFVAKSSFSQTGGNGIFRFLNLPNTSKIAALGNAFPVSNQADFTDAFQNPSLINANAAGFLALNYSNYISDINFGAVQYGLKLKKTEVISTGLMFINYGNFEETDASGNATGNTFTAGDYLLNIGYAKNWEQKVFYGINAKVIYGSYDIYNSFALATDLAVTYQDSSRNLSTGIILKNIGYQLKPFNQKREHLPFEIALSFTQKLKHAPLRYHISYANLQNFDLTYSDPNDQNAELNLLTGEPILKKATFSNRLSRHFIFGAELLLTPSFNIQTGYNLQKSKELNMSGTGGLAGFSFGFSLHLKKISIGYAHATLNAAGSNNYFSLQLKPSIFKAKN